VAFRRDADHEADKALKKLLKQSQRRPGSERDPGVHLLLATWPTWPRTATTSGAAPCTSAPVTRKEGSIEVAMSRLRWAGIAPKTIAATLAQSYVSPVLTAHPTEVQRKSILDAERSIAQLLAERDEIKMRGAFFENKKDALTARELATNEAQHARPGDAVVADPPAAL
jgi:phosphoenolpyruvate carboxylase